MGELIARSVTNSLYRFVIPAVAGPARLVPLASLADETPRLTANALRVAAIRGRLRAHKSGQGTWLSSKKWVQEMGPRNGSKKWVQEYQKNKYSRGWLNCRGDSLSERVARAVPAGAVRAKVESAVGLASGPVGSSVLATGMRTRMQCLRTNLNAEFRALGEGAQPQPLVA
jgi:hypothetical protein